MKNTQRSHRHFVVAPLALALVLFCFAGGSLGTADLPAHIADHASPVSQRVIDGVTYLHESSVELLQYEHRVILRAGDVYVQSPGLIEFDVAHLRLTAVRGSFYVSKTDTKTTIAALTTPVLVREGTREMLIPTGQQWVYGRDPLTGIDAGIALWKSVRTTSAIPDVFLHDAIKKLSAVTVDTTFLPPKQSFVLSKSSPVLLPHAHERKRQEQNTERLGYLRHLIDTSDQDAIDALLSDASFAEFLQTDPGRKTAAYLLSSTEESTIVASLIVHLLHDAHLWMLASVHPDYSAYAWTFALPELTKQQRILLGFSVPHHDVHYHGFNSLVIGHWENLLGSIMSDASQPAVLFDSLVDDLSVHIHTLTREGYPKRAEAYVQALLRVSTVSDRTLSDHAVAEIEKLRTLHAVSLQEIDSLQEEEETSISHESTEIILQEFVAEDAMHPSEVLERAHRILSEGGALFTTDTLLSAGGPNTAIVEDIIFSSPHADRLFDFHINVVRGELNHITENGKTYPYSMWVEDFFEWVSD